MSIVKTVLIVLFIIDGLIGVVLTLMQNKDSRGASETITGSSTNNFYEKNKTRTREGKLKKYTIIAMIAFFVLSIALGVVFVLDK